MTTVKDQFLGLISETVNNKIIRILLLQMRFKIMKSVKLENIHRGDIVIYHRKKAIVQYCFCLDFRQRYYHTNRPIWRIRFANGKGMNLCPRNEAKFSMTDETAVPGLIAVSQEENNEWMKKLENGEMISVI